MPGPTYSLFSEQPASVILESSSNFDGTAQTGTPAKSAGGLKYPAQAGGGLFNFSVQTRVVQIAYKGGGTLTIKQVTGTVEITIGTISSEGAFTTPILFTKGQQLKLLSAGATSPIAIVTAQEVVR